MKCRVAVAVAVNVNVNVNVNAHGNVFVDDGGGFLTPS